MRASLVFWANSVMKKHGAHTAKKECRIVFAKCLELGRNGVSFQKQEGGSLQDAFAILRRVRWKLSADCGGDGIGQSIRREIRTI